MDELKSEKIKVRPAETVDFLNGLPLLGHLPTIATTLQQPIWA
jgi:hypothetical protein